jgi:hypothetical protein
MWRLTSLLLLACLSGMTVGAAASLTRATDGLGAVKVSVPRCTNVGLLVLPNLSGSNVISVTVSNLPSACGGAAIQATVNSGSANSSGSGTVPAGGGSVTVILAAGVAATTNAQIELLVTGP